MTGDRVQGTRKGGAARRRKLGSAGEPANVAHGRLGRYTFDRAQDPPANRRIEPPEVSGGESIELARHGSLKAFGARVSERHPIATRASLGGRPLIDFSERLTSSGAPSSRSSVEVPAGRLRERYASGSVASASVSEAATTNNCSFAVAPRRFHTRLSGAGGRTRAASRQTARAPDSARR